MLARAQLAEPSPRPDASPGLLRRRYSVPETIMRKYRLAQQRSDSEESGPVAPQSAASACPSPAREASRSPCSSPHRRARRDRELMRRSALLRRMRAPACRCCEPRSPDGSPAPSRRSPAPRAASKRQRLDLSDSTFRSHRADRDLSSYVDTITDPYTDSAGSSGRLSEPATAEPDSDTVSASVTTAKETAGDLSSDGRIEGRVSERSAGVENDDRNLPPSAGPLAVDAAATPSELLEIIVSETSAVAVEPRGGLAPATGSGPTLDKFERHMNIDEYVSNILVESLNSLTDQLECMTASIGSDRRISIVEKEIKVKLQNTGVNTIVHLSPTSNHQIIFGNEELCNESRCARDERDHPLSIREEREHSAEPNDAAAGEPPPQHDDVNRAVLQQIQKLFRDELRGLEDGALPGELSDVDAYIDRHSEEGANLEIATGAGNYFPEGHDAVAVPRFSAYPHTASMEVNASSSEDADAIGSECTSLVDSLEDPNSPRAALLRRRADLARSAVDVLELLPEGARGVSAETRGEAFFVRIEEDDRDGDPEKVKVAEYMPDRIKRRLYRRQRKREQRMECARRSKVKQLKRELERRRLEEEERARRELERDCAAILAALVDDVVTGVARDEYRCARIGRRNGTRAAAGCDRDLSRRTTRTDPESIDDGDGGKNAKNGGSRHISDKENEKSERYHIRGQLLARPSLPPSDRPPRRIYQKSEIREGEKRIEILEILEYVNGSLSSPETTNSDENHDRNSKCKKSRIPVPVSERMQRTARSEVRMRLTGGDGLGAGHPVPGERAPPPEPRSRSNSLRFKRVFDIIPEERGPLGAESPAEEAAPRRGRSTRSAATSPLAAEGRARRLRSQTTMTSPCSKSAATSPPPPQPRPAREGGRERMVGGEPASVRSGRGSGGGGSSRSLDPAGSGSGSSSSESGGSLLCSLAPRWLAPAARQRRRARRPPAPPPAPSPPAPPHADRRPGSGAGGWSVTVAGSCRAALPADVEMRLRFPPDSRAAAAAGAEPRDRRDTAAAAYRECACAALPPAPPAAPPGPPGPPLAHDGRLTLTMKKEAQDSSILASKSTRKSSAHLPELETYRASRTKLKSSLKTRRGYSLHCWLPDDEPAPIRANNGLSVLGCAIIPELKPRVPTMSERDLTRVYTPRHYLRS